MSAGWRCFVAVPLDDGIRSALWTSVQAWRGEPPADVLRWAEPDGWHLTLAFLGSIDPERTSTIASAVSEVADGQRPTEIATARLGAFPRPGSARVLWYGVTDPAGGLATISGAMASALRLPPDEPYRPHVTLARARRRPVDLRGWIERASESAPEGRLSVASVQLMRSHLGSGPARYETLATFTLGGAP